MTDVYYIGLDVHKKTVAYCIQTIDGQMQREGTVAATREALSAWAAGIERPWIGALEATLFSGWIYDHLQPYAQQLQVAHPLLLKAITAAKKKSDRIDARTLTKLLRADALPTCYMARRETRRLRQVLRYRQLLVRQAVRMKNRIAGLLMEAGEPYVKEQLHRRRYFYELLDSLEVPASVHELLSISRHSVEYFERLQRELLSALRSDPLLAARVERLRTIRGVGEVVALTWALEIDDPARFPSIARAVSYCGLSSRLIESAGKTRRGPLSKQRNAQLQATLIEAAKLAPRFNPALAEVHARESARGHRNRATLAVARKMVAYLLAVDKSGQPFVPRPPQV